MTGPRHVLIPLSISKPPGPVRIAGASTGQGRRPHPPSPPTTLDPLGLQSQLARQIAVVTSDCGLVFAIISTSRLNSAVKIHTVHQYPATQSTVRLCGFRGEQIDLWLIIVMFIVGSEGWVLLCRDSLIYLTDLNARL